MGQPSEIQTGWCSPEEIQDILNEWIKGDTTNENKRLRRFMPTLGRIVLGAAKTPSGAPLEPDLLNEIQQQIWMMILKRKEKKELFTSFLPANLWLWTTARFAIKHHYSGNNRYALAGDLNDPIGGDAWMEDDAGSHARDPLSTVMGMESEQQMESAAEAAMSRIRGHLKELVDLPTLPSREREPSPIGPALSMRSTIKNLHWSQQQMADYLGVSLNIVNNYLYGRTPIPDHQMARTHFAEVHLAGKPRPTWDTLIQAAESDLKTTDVRLRQVLAERLGVSTRTLRRWINSGKGSEKGLQAAIALKDRDWKRN